MKRIHLIMDEDEKKEVSPPRIGNDADYDLMTDEEYMKEMEKKVEFYKENYPDMYEKAMQWLKMLEHSEMYKTHSGEEVKEDSSMFLKANDILKNATFNGLDETDLTEKEITLLNEHIPDWKNKIKL
jgi:hypothetical protein